MCVFDRETLEELIQRVEGSNTFPWNEVAYRLQITIRDIRTFHNSLVGIYKEAFDEYPAYTIRESLGSLEEDCNYIANLLINILDWHNTPQGGEYWHNWYTNLKTIAAGITVDNREEPKEFPEFIV